MRMIIVIFPIIYFYAVIVAIAAVGVELAVFLQKWILEISIVLWILCAVKSFRAGIKSKDSEEKIWLFSMPIALIPILYMVIQSLYDCVLRTTALKGIFLLFLGFPVSFCGTLVVCLGSVWIGSWFRKHTWLGVLVAAIGNGYIFQFMYRLWGPIG